MHPLRRNFLVAALIIICVLVPLWPAFEGPGLAMDEGALLVYPELMLKGQMPYRDFETFYGPANSLVLSAAYAGPGPSIFVERSVGLLYRILILAAFFALIQRWNTTIAAGCTFVAGLFILPTNLPAYAWIGGVMCALWSLWMVLNPVSARRCFFGGLCAALALLYRPDLAPAMLASGLPLFLLMSWPRRWNYLAGAVVGLLPYLWLTIVAGPGQMLNNLFLFPVFYCSPGRRLPISAGDTYVICLFSVHVIAVLTNLIAGTLAIRRSPRDPSARLVLSLGLLALGLTHQAMQRFDFGHIISAALLSVSVLPLSIFVLQSQRRPAGDRIRYSEPLLATAMTLVLLLSLAPELGGTVRNQIINSLNAQPRGPIFVEHRGRSFPVRSMREAISLDHALGALESVSIPGDRLFVGPADLRRTNYNDTFIYHMLPQLQPASYFLEMNPHSANRPNSRMAQDIAQADWLVLSHHFDAWNEPNDSVAFGSDAPMKVVEHKFDLCGRYDAYDIYRRRTPVASSR